MKLYSEMQSKTWIFRIDLTKNEVRAISAILAVINTVHVYHGTFDQVGHHKTLTHFLTAKQHSISDLQDYIKVINHYKVSMTVFEYGDANEIIRDLTWGLTNIGVNV
jgi:hypothetical protein